MELCLSLRSLPWSASVLQACALPCGATLCPYPRTSSTSRSTSVSSSSRSAAAAVTAGPEAQVARCGNCFAYINSLASFSASCWRCPLCSHETLLTTRYHSRPHLPELQGRSVELQYAEHTRTDAKLVFVFVIDLITTRNVLDVLLTAVVESVRALPDNAHVALLLITTVSTIGAFALEASVPLLFEVQLEHANALVLQTPLVPLQHTRSALERALDGLVPAPPASKAASGQRRTHAVLQAALQLVKDTPGSTIVLLSGAPQQEDAFPPVHPARLLLALVLEPRESRLLSVPAVARAGGLLVFGTDDSERLALLPQHLAAILMREQLFDCLLRVRCSPGFRVAKVLGSAQPDPRGYENLYCLERCDSFTSVPLIFELDASAGDLRQTHTMPIVMQVTFSYHCLLPSGGVGRRLRVLTRRVEVAQSMYSIYADASPSIVFSLLLAEANALALNGESSPAQLRQLLQDWLVNLSISYNQYAQTSGSDPLMKRLESLQELPRLIYSACLHRSLSPGPISDEQRLLAQYELCSLPPRCLQNRVRPYFLAFHSDKHIEPRIDRRLSVTVLEETQEPILVLVCADASFVCLKNDDDICLSDIQDRLSLNQEGLLRPLYSVSDSRRAEELRLRLVDDDVAFANLERMLGLEVREDGS